MLEGEELGLSEGTTLGRSDGLSEGVELGMVDGTVLGELLGLIQSHSSIGSQGITISYAQVPIVGVPQEFGDN